MPISLETAVPSGHLNDNIHVSSDSHPERTDAFKNPFKDLRVVTEIIAGNGQLTADTTFSHLIVPAYTALGPGVEGGLIRAKDGSARPLPPSTQPTFSNHAKWWPKISKNSVGKEDQGTGQRSRP